jgi:predicted DNA-binding protein
VDLFYNLLKRKENKLKYQRRDEPLKPLVVRLPLDLKEQLDIASKGQGISQSRLAVELISQGLNQSVSLEAMIEDIEEDRPANDDDQIDLEDWLKRL